MKTSTAKAAPLMCGNSAEKRARIAESVQMNAVNIAASFTGTKSEDVRSARALIIRHYRF
jgi:hypothetical protein